VLATQSSSLSVSLQEATAKTTFDNVDVLFPIKGGMFHESEHSYNYNNYHDTRAREIEASTQRREKANEAKNKEADAEREFRKREPSYNNETNVSECCTIS